MSAPVIDVARLVKRYGNTVAVGGLTVSQATKLLNERYAEGVQRPIL